MDKTNVNEQCHAVARALRELLSSSNLDLQKFEAECKKLLEMMTALPLQSDIDKEVLGNELESEMARMSAAIRAAVEEIEKIQEKSRNNTEGIR
ncbi:unnamed protein product [Strongylus vulgaris]|uniref:Uncharacterized protein n=1 Tax=Strongylus vulgaris TaxID=40348 RepID=A0A3P7JF89_STRVU|nr:unnamed protein product [Strongylus vulgaris]